MRRCGDFLESVSEAEGAVRFLLILRKQKTRRRRQENAAVKPPARGGRMWLVW